MPNRRLKIIVEAGVPYTEPLAEVADTVWLPYGEITPDAVADADAMIVRTRNRCDKSLLEGSKVSFIATATIGTDHIDLPWCRANGITVANAPGCNAPAVAQYVFSCLMRLINRPISSYRLGIVGVGHVGKIVERWARAMSIKVMLCDPPRQAAEGGDGWSTLDEMAAQADIVTFHTPLTFDGPYPTFHLADEAFFNRLGRAPIIINAARGAVVDNRAWAEAIEAGQCGPAVVDCWEGEPNPNVRLLADAAIATPHIAGYSAAGKLRATRMALDALGAHFNLPALKATPHGIPGCPEAITPAEAIRSYDPMPESDALKSVPEDFEKIRAAYPLRNEPLNVFPT